MLVSAGQEKNVVCAQFVYNGFFSIMEMHGCSNAVVEKNVLSNIFFNVH